MTALGMGHQGEQADDLVGGQAVDRPGTAGGASGTVLPSPDLAEDLPVLAALHVQALLYGLGSPA